MANTRSARKAARKTQRQTEINKASRSNLKTEVRKVEEAIQSGNRKAAQAALAAAEPVLARNGQKGIIHKRTASRKVSRLAARVKSMPQ